MGCGHSSEKVHSADDAASAAKRVSADRGAHDAAPLAGGAAPSAATASQPQLPAGAAEPVVQPSDGSGSSVGTPSHGSLAGKPPKGSRHGRAQLDTLQEPTNGSTPAQAMKESDSSGFASVRPLNSLLPPPEVSAASPPQAPSAGAGTLPAIASPQAADAAAARSAADRPPAELAHVLSLLSRLLSASAVLVDLQDPPATYIKDSTELRTSDPGEAASLRQSGGYQEVALVGRGGVRLGTLGAAVPGGGATPSPMLTQMASVVVREVETLQASSSVRRPSHAVPPNGTAAAPEPEWRPPAAPAVVLVDVTNGEWRTLAVEDAIKAVTATSAAGWMDASIWDHLHAPFSKQSGAWRAVNEVAAASGDLIITGVGCRADPSRGPLVLRCTPANAAILAAQARPREWMDALDAAQHSRMSTDSVETAQTSADVMAETAQAFASGQGAVAVQQQRQRQPYLVTIARQSLLGFPRPATDSGRWTTQGSSSLTTGSNGQILEEVSQGVPVDDVQLGPMLGKGSYGRVYHGYWQGTEVAIKVCTQGIARSGDRTVKPWAGVEAVASLALHHPGVMRTLNHTTVVVPAPPSRTVRHASLHMPDISPPGGPQHGARTSFDFGAMGRPGPSPAMVRSASSDMDGSQNTSHGTQLARPFPIAALRSGDSTSSGGRGPPIMPPAILSPFAAPVAAAAPAPAPAPSSGPPNFSPFADARRAVQDPASNNGSGSGSGGTGSAGNSAERAQLSGTAATVQALRGNSLGLPETVGLGTGSLRGVVPEQQAEVDTWVVMEYCNRGTLQRALEDGLFSFEDEDGGRRPNMTAVLVAAKQLAAAMAYMHERGVIHGDLSRANILLMDSEESPSGFDVKVADFGMARQLDVQSRIDTFSCGTITHTAPELMDEGHLSRAADVFAAGVLMWELWNGSGAWSGMNQAQIISAVLIHNKRPTFPPDAPKDYADLARQCMATDPKERPTFSEVEQRVAVMLRGLGTANGVQ